MRTPPSSFETSCDKFFHNPPFSTMQAKTEYMPEIRRSVTPSDIADNISETGSNSGRRVSVSVFKNISGEGMMFYKHPFFSRGVLGKSVLQYYISSSSSSSAVIFLMPKS